MKSPESRGDYLQYVRVSQQTPGGKLVKRAWYLICVLLH